MATPILKKLDTSVDMSDSHDTLLTLDDSSSSTSTASGKMVRFQADPKQEGKVLVIKHRYRKPKNPADLYVNSEEQYQYCLATRAHAKTLRQELELMVADSEHVGWLEMLGSFLAPTRAAAKLAQEPDPSLLLPLQYALEEQVRGLEKEILVHFKQQCAQHRRRHAQKIVLSQSSFQDDNDQLLADLSQKSSAKANALARMLAIIDEHYVVDLHKKEPFVMPVAVPAPVVQVANEPPTAKQHQESTAEPPRKKRSSNTFQDDLSRKPPTATRSFGRFTRKERKLPGASRSFKNTFRRLNFRRKNPPSPPPPMVPV